MRESRTLLLSGLILLGLAGLALSQDKGVTPTTQRPQKQKAGKAASSGAPTPRPGDYPVIGYLEKQDRTITIKSGPNSALYSVRTADGKALLENVTLEQVRAQAPELHEFLKSAVAGRATGKADASLRIRFNSSIR